MVVDLQIILFPHVGISTNVGLQHDRFGASTRRNSNNLVRIQALSRNQLAQLQARKRTNDRTLAVVVNATGGQCQPAQPNPIIVLGGKPGFKIGTDQAMIPLQNLILREIPKIANIRLVVAGLALETHRSAPLDC